MLSVMDGDGDGPLHMRYVYLATPLFYFYFHFRFSASSDGLELGFFTFFSFLRPFVSVPRSLVSLMPCHFCCLLFFCF